MSAMRPTDLLVLAAVLLILSPAAHATVESTCKGVSLYTDYDFCVKILQSDPTGVTADLHGHALIATNRSSEKAAEVFAKIQTLLKSSLKMDERLCLSTCSEQYRSLIFNLHQAWSAIKESRKDDAMDALSASYDAQDTCELGFEHLKVPSLLAAEDKDQAQLCTLAFDICSMF